MNLSLHRCKVCGTRWLLWPDEVHGGGWNLLDQWQRPGSCCDNVAMGEQIEHLRDIPLSVPVSEGRTRMFCEACDKGEHSLCFGGRCECEHLVPQSPVSEGRTEPLEPMKALIAQWREAAATLYRNSDSTQNTVAAEACMVEGAGTLDGCADQLEAEVERLASVSEGRTPEPKDQDDGSKP